MCVCVFVCVCAYTHVCMSMCMCVGVCMHAHMHVSMAVHMTVSVTQKGTAVEPALNASVGIRCELALKAGARV